MRKRRWQLIVTIVLLLGFAPLQAWGALPPRVNWEYTDPGYKSYLGSLAITPEETFLVTRNGFHEPAVLELNNKGEIIWEYGPIQANSAVRLSNGNVLIADSGAPGYPLKPRIIEVSRKGKIVWSHELPSRADSPRLARELSGGRVLAVLADRVVEIDRNGKTLWQYGGLYYPVWAERLASGNTLVVDRGFYGGKVLEVDPQGNVLWEYGTYGMPGNVGQLSRPVWATRLADGSTLISDRGFARLVKVEGQESEVVNEWREVLNALPVSDRWVALPSLDQRQIYLSLTLSGGRSVLWQVEREIKTFVRGEAYKFQTSPVEIEGILYGGAREFLNLVGVEVEWKQETKELKISHGGEQSIVKVDDREGWIAGQRVKLAPPKIHGGTTVLPLEFMREYFGLDYRWNQETRELDIWL